MKKTKQLITSLFCIALGASSVYAASGTWDQTKSGNWTDTANWIGGIVADGASSILTGGQITANNVTRTITLNEDHTIGGLNMSVNGFNRAYAFAGSGIITLDNGGSPVQIRGVNGPNFVNVVLAGTPASVQYAYQAGRIILGGANTYSAPVFIYRGEVKIAHVDALPYGSRTGDITLITGGNPGNQPKIDLDDFDITINGLLSDTNSTTAGTLPKITSESVNAGTSTITIGDNNANGLFDGTIDDGPFRQVAVTKTGGGTQSLRGANAYTGATTVNAGVLAIDGSISSPVTVNGGVLGGVGTIYGTVSVSAGGAIGAGSSVGKLILASSMDLSAGGTNIWELGTLTDNSTGTPGTDFDLIDYQSVSSSFDLTDASLIVDVSAVNTADPFWGSTRTWTIITSFGQTGGSNFKAVEVRGSTPAGTFTTANNGTTVELTFTPGAVPFTPPKPKVTSVVPTSPTSVTVNYTNTLAGTNYVVQYRTNLNTTNWISLAPVLAGGTTSSSTDTPPAGSAHRYYRVYGQF